MWVASLWCGSCVHGTGSALVSSQVRGLPAMHGLRADGTPWHCQGWRAEAPDCEAHLQRTPCVWVFIFTGPKVLCLELPFRQELLSVSEGHWPWSPLKMQRFRYSSPSYKFQFVCNLLASCPVLPIISLNYLSLLIGCKYSVYSCYTESFRRC